MHGAIVATKGEGQAIEESPHKTWVLSLPERYIESSDYHYCMSRNSELTRITILGVLFTVPLSTALSSGVGPAILQELLLPLQTALKGVCRTSVHHREACISIDITGRQPSKVYSKMDHVCLRKCQRNLVLVINKEEVL